MSTFVSQPAVRPFGGKRGGFTLIELILVTVIIAVLAGMVTLNLRGTAKDAAGPSRC